MSPKRLLLLLTFMVMLLVLTFVLKAAILRGPVVRLQKSQPLAGVVSQGLASSGPTNSLPEFGKDYTLQSIRYYDNKAWVTATVVPLSTKTDNALVVIHMINGSYQVVLGPGTAFPNNYLQGLPADVSQYLLNQGVIYEPTVN
jgi:hypothetical protein